MMVGVRLQLQRLCFAAIDPLVHLHQGLNGVFLVVKEESLKRTNSL